MPKQPESKFKRRLTDAFTAAYPGGEFTYVGVGGPGQKRGFPDLFFILPERTDPTFSRRARHLWIEAKVAPNAVTGPQARVIAAMRNAACEVLVVTYHPETKAIHAARSAIAGAHFTDAKSFWRNYV